MLGFLKSVLPVASTSDFRLDEILDYLDVDEKYSVTMNGGVVYIASGSRNGY